MEDQWWVIDTSRGYANARMARYLDEAQCRAVAMESTRSTGNVYMVVKTVAQYRAIPQPNKVEEV